MTTMTTSAPSSFRVIALGAIASIASGCQATPPAPQMLVTGFTSDAVVQVDGGSGRLIGSFGPSVGMDGPLCTRVGPDGWLYVASEESNSVLRFDACSGTLHDVFIPPASGGLAGPSALTWLPNGDLLVASFDSDAVLRYDGATGSFLSVFVAPGSGGLNGPDNGTTIGPDGDLYVPSYWTNRILRYDSTTGAFKSVFVNGVGRPRVLVFANGVLYVTSETADTVLRYNATTGAAMGPLFPAGTAGMDLPIGLAIAPSGPDAGDFFVSSGSQNKVYRFSGSNGAFEAIPVPAGTGGLIAPVFITFLSCPTDPTPDIDGDGAVSANDLALLLGAWGATGGSDADLDGSGVVDAADLAALLGAWT